MFLSINVFSTSKLQAYSSVFLCPWATKDSWVQNDISVIGSRLIDQIGFYWSWSQPINIFFFTMYTVSMTNPQRLSCQQTFRSFLGNKRLSYHVFCMWCLYAEPMDYFLYRKSIVRNLNWPEASVIPQLGCMPRSISWHRPVTNVLIARSFWVFPPFCFLIYYHHVPKATKTLDNI